MSDHRLDLDAYFERIGYGGRVHADLETLRAIVAHHGRSVPFENISVQLNQGVSLALNDIEEKLVHRRRGGYCFEQNSLLLGVLGQVGFNVTPLSARIRSSSPRDVVPPRTHLFLKVDIDGAPWLADVGVGGLTPTAPLRMDTQEPQPTSHETHRIVHEEGHGQSLWFHQVLVGEQWIDVCDFTGEQMHPIDRELANWWTSMHPMSKFRLNLLVALAGEDGTRRGIQNDRFTRRRGATVLETYALTSQAQLREVLAREFGLVLEAGVELTPPGVGWPLQGH